MALKVKLENGEAFSRALAESERELEDELDAAMYEVATDVRDYAARKAPTRSGTLSAGYNVSGSDGKYHVDNPVPYAEGAEFGTKGKWKGFARYGRRAKRFLFAAKSVVLDASSRAMRRFQEVLERNGFLS